MEDLKIRSGMYLVISKAVQFGNNIFMHLTNFF